MVAAHYNIVDRPSEIDKLNRGNFAQRTVCARNTYIGELHLAPLIPINKIIGDMETCNTETGVSAHRVHVNHRPAKIYINRSFYSHILISSPISTTLNQPACPWNVEGSPPGELANFAQTELQVRIKSGSLAVQSSNSPVQGDL